MKGLTQHIFFSLQILVANRNEHHTAQLLLNPRIRARYLRIVPHSGTGDLCLRVEIRGCSKGALKNSVNLYNITNNNNNNNSNNNNNNKGRQDVSASSGSGAPALPAG